MNEIKDELNALSDKYGEMLFIGGSFPKNGFDMFKDIQRLLEIIKKIQKANE